MCMHDFSLTQGFKKKKRRSLAAFFLCPLTFLSEHASVQNVSVAGTFVSKCLVRDFAEHHQHHSSDRHAVCRRFAEGDHVH